MSLSKSLRMGLGTITSRRLVVFSGLAAAAGAFALAGCQWKVVSGSGGGSSGGGAGGGSGGAGGADWLPSYEQVNAASPTTATVLAVADVDASGSADVLVGGPSGVGVMLSAPDGTLAAAPFVIPASVSALALGDFDGDGALDAAVATGGLGASGKRLLFQGFGDGSFALAGELAGGAAALLAADLDSNGADELVSALAGSVEVRAAQGVVASIEVASVSALGVGDLDGESGLDLVLGSEADVLATVSVWLSAGSSFQEASSLAVGDGALSALAVGKVNAKPGADVVVRGDGGLGLVVLSSDGAGALTPGSTLELTDAPVRSVALVDLDADGELDVVALDADGSVTAAQGLGDGTFAGAGLLGTATGASQLAVGVGPGEVTTVAAAAGALVWLWVEGP
jgi:hypothetical protein